MKIFVIHGWAYSMVRWRKIIPLLKKEGFDPIQLKVPGLTLKSDKVFSIDDYVNWLEKELKNEKEVIILAHSNGGRIALNYSLKHPEKIKHLFLIGSAGVYHDELPIRLKRYFFKVSAKVGKQVLKADIFKKILYKLAGTTDYRDADPNMKQTMLNMINSDKSLRLEDVSVPVTLIWGKHDKTTPLGDGIKMEERIENSKLFVIDNARHSPHLTNPEEVVEKIVNQL